jgi:DNA repair exonuclease SbcCD ATPase subunit
VLFPILINCMALLISGIGFIFFNFAFLASEQKINFDARQYQSSDAKLIQDELKKNADKLKAKEMEISKIQEEMTKIDQEKENLKSSMDSEINSKKLELEKMMQSELDKERENLKKQNLSTEDIDAKIAELKKGKEIEFNDQIESFRKKAEDDMKKNEENLVKIKDAYNQDLAKAATEKETLNTALKDKEKEEMELRKKAEESTTAKTEAEEKLKLLSEQREKEELINSQILGLYSRVETNIGDEDFANALSALSEMRKFFDDKKIVALPSVMKRRNVELFIIDSLERLINRESSKTKVDTASLIEKAGYIASISEKYQAAEGLVKQRKFEEAQKMYQDTLDIIPEIRASFTRIGEYETSAKTAAYEDYASKGDSLFKNKEYSAAIQTYSKALKTFPKDQAGVDTMVSRIVEAGYLIKGDSDEKAKEEQAAGRLITQANVLITNKYYADAINTYTEILAKYPRSTRIEEARDGISKTLQTVNNQYQTQNSGNVDKLTSDLAVRDTKIQELTGTIDTINSSLVSKNEEIAQYKIVEKDLTGKISDLAQQRDKLAAELDKAKRQGQNTSATVTNPKGGENQDPKLVNQEIERLNAELKNYDTLKSEVDLIKSKYLEYADKEDKMVKQKGTMAYLTTKTYLGQLLSTPFVKNFFPDLYERIKKYDEATYLDAREDGKYLAIDSVLTIIDNRMALGKSSNPKDYWKKIKAENKDNTILLDLVSELEKIIDK